MNCLENLANEIFYEIFIYLDGFNLHNAFSDLNIRFQQLLAFSSPKLKVDYSSPPYVNNSNGFIDMILHYKHRLISLVIGIPLIANKFFEKYTIDSSYNHLKSLKLVEININKLESLLRNLKPLSRLFTLTIKLCDIQENLTNVYQLIFDLPALKYMKVSYNFDQTSIHLLPALIKQSSTIEYFIIDHACKFNDFIKILAYVPRLTHLTSSKLYQSKENNEREISISLSNLISLSIGLQNIEFDKMQLFISKICSQLQVFHLHYKGRNQSYLDADQWEEFILEKISHLRKFILHYGSYFRNDWTFEPHSALINCFNSTFWINRPWLFELKVDWFLSSNQQVTHTIHSYRYKRMLSHLNQNDVDLSPSVELASIKWNDIQYYDWLIHNIHSAISPINISSVSVDFSSIKIDTFISVLHILPHLKSLKIIHLYYLKLNQLTDENIKDLDFLKNNNKITNLTMGSVDRLEIIRFFIDLCPQMKYFQIKLKKYFFELDPFIQYILKQISNHIISLYILSILIPEITDRLTENIRSKLDKEPLNQDYTIKCSFDKICLYSK
jgi:hypothetical protein